MTRLLAMRMKRTSNAFLRHGEVGFSRTPPALELCSTTRPLDSFEPGTRERTAHMIQSLWRDSNGAMGSRMGHMPYLPR
jgi:hypothetical protein